MDLFCADLMLMDSSLSVEKETGMTLVNTSDSVLLTKILL